MQERDLTIAVYEDLTGGATVERLQKASQKHFVGGVIGNSENSMRHLLTASGVRQDRIDGFLHDDPALTDELARAVRIWSETRLGLAVHGVPQGDQSSENLGQGQTYVALVGDGAIRSRVYNYAGRGLPDRLRVSLNAMDLVRLTLMGEL